MIKIDNSEKLFSNKQLQAIINLLPKDYQELEFSLVLLHNKFEIIKNINLENIFNFKKIYQKLILGTSCYKHKKIYIYCNNFDLVKSEYVNISKLRIIHCILHEIRHFYQYKYMKNILDKHWVKYDERKQEKDADEFASEFMNKNYSMIYDIICKTNN